PNPRAIEPVVVHACELRGDVVGRDPERSIGVLGDEGDVRLAQRVRVLADPLRRGGASAITEVRDLTARARELVARREQAWQRVFERSGPGSCGESEEHRYREEKQFHSSDTQARPVPAWALSIRPSKKLWDARIWSRPGRCRPPLPTY